MVKSKDIELFKNLSQHEYSGMYFDFHNDYDCIKLLLTSKKCLVLEFKNNLNHELVELKFMEAVINEMNFFNSAQVENLTIDNLYRGRITINEELVSLKEPNYGYFYLEFDEGQKLEFWSSGIVVKIQS